MNKLFCTVLLLFFAFSTYAWRPGEMEVKVYLNTLTEAQQVAALEYSGEIHMSVGYALFYVIPEELKAIKKLNLSYEIVIQDVNAHFEEVMRSSMHADAVITEMNNLASKYPTLCKKYEFGKSVKGKELSAIKISDNVGSDENEPEILFDGNIHGDETGGSDLLIRFSKYLCENYATDTKIKTLLDSREVWIFPLVNPDSKGTQRGNANGVDLNRNWGYMADLNITHSNRAQKNGFSQPEIRAVRNCMMENQFTLQYSYHQGMEGLLYPWCHKSAAPIDQKVLKNLCDLYSNASGYYKASGNKQSYADMPTSGETIDYAYGAMGILSLTMEISRSKGSLADKFYPYNQLAMLKVIEYAGFGVEGVVKDAVTKKPIAAILFVDKSFPFYSDPVVGDYHHYLEAGSYSIKVAASGYKTKSIENVTIEKEKSTKLDIELEPDGGSKSVFGYKVVFAENGQGTTSDILGPADQKTFSGNVVIDMLYPIIDISGNEIKLLSSGSNATVSAGETADGPWQSLGNGTDFDLSKASLKSARFFKITGGATVDAIEATYELPTNNITKNNLIVLQYQPVMQVSSNNQKIFINVSCNSNVPYTVKIYNIRGTLCWGSSNKTFSQKYGSSILSSGTYIVTLCSDLGTQKIPICLMK